MNFDFKDGGHFSQNMNWFLTEFKIEGSLFFAATWVSFHLEEKKGTQQWKQCNLSHSQVSCNHLLFSRVTSALAKFMWPLPWPLTSMKKHLFEGKDSWHNPTSNLLMWFTLYQWVAAKNSAVPEADVTARREG